MKCYKSGKLAETGYPESSPLTVLTKRILNLRKGSVNCYLHFNYPSVKYLFKCSLLYYYIYNTHFPVSRIFFVAAKNCCF